MPRSLGTLLYVVAAFAIVFGLWFAPILLVPGSLGVALFILVTIIGAACMWKFGRDQ